MIVGQRTRWSKSCAGIATEWHKVREVARDVALSTALSTRHTVTDACGDQLAVRIAGGRRSSRECVCRTAFASLGWQATSARAARRKIALIAATILRVFIRTGPRGLTVTRRCRSGQWADDEVGFGKGEVIAELANPTAAGTCPRGEGTQPEQRPSGDLGATSTEWGR
jgi:hypothetical protein